MRRARAVLTGQVQHAKTEPPMTRFMAHQLSTAHWYEIGAARRDLDYEPSISIEEGLARLAESFGR